MHIYAKIHDVKKVEAGLELSLCRTDEDPEGRGLGPVKMVILSPTVEPLAGDILEAASTFAVIHSEGIDFPYRREGDSKLKQNW